MLPGDEYMGTIPSPAIQLSDHGGYELLNFWRTRYVCLCNSLWSGRTNQMSLKFFSYRLLARLCQSQSQKGGAVFLPHIDLQQHRRVNVARNRRRGEHLRELVRNGDNPLSSSVCVPSTILMSLD